MSETQEAPRKECLPIKVATCMPRQERTREAKLAWLRDAVSRFPCDLFVTPQEYFGGHYIMPDDLHIERGWLVEHVGAIARDAKTAIGVGACAKNDGGGATEDFIYFGKDGRLLGWHSKFALPAYDDIRAPGHGQLWPETSYQRRVRPIAIPELRLKVGTVFCWEAFSQSVFPAYSFAGANLIAHPIKFAPRGWLKNEKKPDGMFHIVGFGHAPKSGIWMERLRSVGRHEALCPIAVSCNSWDLGAKFMALVGHVDELRGATVLEDVPSVGTEERVRVFEMVPEFYDGLDHMHSAGAFVAHVGSLDGFSALGEWTMHAKMRRLEAQLIGGSTALECKLRASTLGRQKKSLEKRAAKEAERVEEESRAPATKGARLLEKIKARRGALREEVPDGR